MTTRTYPQRTVIALASVLLLAGCTSAPEISATTPAGSESSAAAAPAATAPAETGEAETGPRPVPSVTLTPEPVVTSPEPVPATGVCEISYVDAAEAGTVGGLDIEVVRDRGSRTGATGEVTTGTDGTPASYLVAVGDVSENIADRFCVSAEFLDALNSVRRDGVTIDSLFAGDTLNLSPTTVTSVGTQNGRVLENPEPETLPDQD
ncbi:MULTISPECIES: hypothetical protein [unclassified Rathayibacter]|uniref:hypothetical protein n=1 Tax=unclassified Rathayibacter TaxID=2609250 RepID=UPI0006F59563|nr:MULTISPECIES: hypothetical protein [unclassified Rathayibacter]KQQ06265.1 hypothetical protein ASF42_07075 [Rathayibacter sp. Leaf294]KQS14120.1 hypothetical protein ASG06_07075 [Rathayibacter sp. Leaf185]